MATVLGSLLVSLGLESANFRKGMTDAERQMKVTQQKFEKIGTQMAGIGKGMSLAITAPLAAFGVAATKAAINAEEMESAFAVTFGKSASTVRKWAESTGDAMGRSTQELMEMSMSFQDILKKQMDVGEATELSKDLTLLTQDLASFKNLSNDVAKQKIFSGLIGEAEPLRAVGVTLSAAKVDAKALELGLEKVNGKFTEGAKVQARAAVIMEELKDAQGDVLRTSDSAANMIRRSQAAFEELSITVGTKLIPALTPLIDKLIAALEWFTNLPKPVQDTAIMFGALAAALGPVLFVAGNLTSAFGLLLPAITNLWQGQGILLALKGGVAGLIGALGPLTLAIGAAYLVWNNWDEIAPKFKPIIEALHDLGRGLGLLSTEGQVAAISLQDSFAGIVDSAVTSGAATQEHVDKINTALASMAASGTVDTEAATQITELIAKMQEAGTIAPEEAEKVRLALLKAWEGQRATENKSGWAKLGEDIAAFVSGVGVALEENDRQVGEGLNSMWESFEVFHGHLQRSPEVFRKMMLNSVKWVQALYTGVKNWISDKLGSVFNWLGNKIEWVANKFKWLDDVVVRHSYIPDMVDSIGQHMARLDVLMVDKAAKAAETTAAKFRMLASEVADIMARLYPDEAKFKAYRDDVAKIAELQASGKSPMTNEEADRVKTDLWREAAGPRGDVPISVAQEPLVNGSEVEKAIEGIEKATGLAVEKTKVQTVKIAESFKDMADKTVSAVQNMASAIKGGGFLDILGAAVGMFTQLGSTGLFGSKIATNLNGVAGARAMGGPVSMGKTYLVGERGPELFTAGRTGQIVSNDNLRGMGGGNTYHFSGNLMTPEFWAQIQAGDRAALQGGAQLAGAQMTQQRSRRLA